MHLFLKLFNWLRVRQIKRITTIPKNCIIDHNTSIRLIFGSTGSDIQIGDNTIIRGCLVSCNGGKIKFDEYSQIGINSKIYCIDSVVIGEGTCIANDVRICDNNNHPIHPEDRIIMQRTAPGSKERSWLYSEKAPIVIGKNCWIGEFSRICKGVRIGDNSIVAANSVVTKDVPSNSIVAGNPARVVKENIHLTASRML